MKNIFISIFCFIFLTSCEGLFWASGIIYQNKNGEQFPLDSASIKVFCNGQQLTSWMMTNSSGKYEIGALTTPLKANYYIIFERNGYKTDTIEYYGRIGKKYSPHNHLMIKSEN